MTQFNYLEENINELFSVKETEQLTLSFDFYHNVPQRFRVDYCGDYFLLDVLYVEVTNEDDVLKIVPYTYRDSDGKMIFLETDTNIDDIYEVVNMLFGLGEYELDVDEIDEEWIQLKKTINFLVISQTPNK